MDTHKLSPESLMMSYGYKPQLSEGAVKCPIFQTSTFVFNSAEQGKAFFEVAYGHRQKKKNEKIGLIYSRINNPDMEILEDRLTLWDHAEACAVFESGMSAISTVLMEFLKPGDLLLYSNPIYGGTHHFIHHVLTKFGIQVLGFNPGETKREIEVRLKKSGMEENLAMIYVETPANPTNDLIDIGMCAAIAKQYSIADKKVFVAVDNTYMGPLWQHPLKVGADLVLYSATKYIGGHSDVIAGAVLGNTEMINRVKVLRTFLGNMISPYTGWLLLRSLETLKVRMDQQAANAEKVAAYLSQHPMVEKVYYLGNIKETDAAQYEIYKKQCIGKGAMLSFDIKGGEQEAFTFLNHLKLIKLAVSLGGTESLAEHPATMTHVDIPDEEKILFNISSKMIRLSIGVENDKDLIWDLEQALEKKKITNWLQFKIIHQTA
ncbi:MAG TPA: cystathionine gamma-synthase family protein [Chitinophagaceae bacterium]|nr:cystathionine gamma-synthase family protein [Chitinophagaceae bacterium]